jgi:integrase
LPDTVAGRRDRALLSFFVLTGRRRSEVIGLTAGDLSLNDGTAYHAFYDIVGAGPGLDPIWHPYN